MAVHFLKDLFAQAILRALQLHFEFPDLEAELVLFGFPTDFCLLKLLFPLSRGFGTGAGGILWPFSELLQQYLPGCRFLFVRGRVAFLETLDFGVQPFTFTVPVQLPFLLRFEQARFHLFTDGDGHARWIVGTLHGVDNTGLHSGDLGFQAALVGFEFTCGRSKIIFRLVAGADRFFELEPQLGLQIVREPDPSVFAGVLGNFLKFCNLGVQAAALHSPLVARAFEFLFQSCMLALQFLDPLFVLRLHFSKQLLGGR